MKRQSLAAVVLTAALGIASALVGSCGGIGSDDGVTERVQQPRIITAKRLEGVPEGSPQRTVYAWWRALQFDNPVEASRYYVKSLGLTPERLERQFRYGSALLNLYAMPRLVDVVEEGNRATVQLLLQKAARNPNGRVDRASSARGFNLVRENGEWKLADNFYIERSFENARRLGALVRRAKQGRGQGKGEAKGLVVPEP